MSIEIILFIIFEGILNTVCFYIGAKIGQNVSRGEDVKIPIPNPIEAYNKFEENMDAKLEQAKYDTIMENIDNYDGTPLGQKEIPR